MNFKKSLKQKVIFDRKSQHSKEILENTGFKYFQIGVKND